MQIGTAVIIAFFVAAITFGIFGGTGTAFLYGIIAFFVIVGLSRLKFGKDPDQMPNTIIKLQRYIPKVVNKRDETSVPAETFVSILIPPEAVGLENFRAKDGPKSNDSIAVVGIAGVGKTTLVRYLIEQDNSKQKIIFSFKEDDEYLYMGIPILDVSKTAPNPFGDYAAFTDAFITANPIENKGIQASSIKPRLLKLLAHATTWKELLKQLEVSEKIAVKKGDHNGPPVFALIRDQAEALATTPTRNTNISDYTEKYRELVLDFSHIKDKMSQTFYSEIILRQIWNSKLTGLLAIDEAHRLVHDAAQDSILVLVLREGRSRGLKAVASTQRFTDIYDDAMSNFGTQFVFHTNNTKDLDALPTPMLRHAVLELQPSFFVDANQPDLHQSIDVMHLNHPKQPKHKPEYIQIEQEPEQATSEQTSRLEIASKILDLLESGPMSPTDLTRELGVEKNLVLGELNDLKYKQRTIDSIAFDRPGGKKGSYSYRTFYFMHGANISKIHIFMQEEVIKALENSGVKVKHSAVSGQRELPDIETDIGMVEIETGLKKGNYTDLTKRINASKKGVFIVVPNTQIRDVYQTQFKTNQKVYVDTLYDFILKMEARARPGMKAAETQREEA